MREPWTLKSERVKITARHRTVTGELDAEDTERGPLKEVN